MKAITITLLVLSSWSSLRAQSFHQPMQYEVPVGTFLGLSNEVDDLSADTLSLIHLLFNEVVDGNIKAYPVPSSTRPISNRVIKRRLAYVDSISYRHQFTNTIRFRKDTTIIRDVNIRKFMVREEWTVNDDGKLIREITALAPIAVLRNGHKRRDSKPLFWVKLEELAVFLK